MEASFENMTVPEKQVMVVELLRVISAILSEVAQAYTNSMASRATRTGAGHDQEQALEKETVMKTRWCKDSRLTKCEGSTRPPSKGRSMGFWGPPTNKPRGPS